VATVSVLPEKFNVLFAALVKVPAPASAVAKPDEIATIPLFVNVAPDPTVTAPVKVAEIPEFMVIDPFAVVVPEMVKFPEPLTANEPVPAIVKLPPSVKAFAPKLKVVAPLTTIEDEPAVMLILVVLVKFTLLFTTIGDVALIRIKVPVLVISPLKVTVAPFDVLLNVPAFENVLPKTQGEAETPVSSRSSPVERIEKAPEKVSVPPVLPSTTNPERLDVPVTVKLFAPMVNEVPVPVVKFPPIDPTPVMVEVVLEDNIKSPVVVKLPEKATVPADFERVRFAVALQAPLKVTAPDPDIIWLPVKEVVLAPEIVNEPSFIIPPLKSNAGVVEFETVPVEETVNEPSKRFSPVVLLSFIVPVMEVVPFTVSARLVSW